MKHMITMTDRHEARSRAAITAAVFPAFLFIAVVTGSARAEPPQGNDYYGAAGTELLHNVELYHQGEAANKIKAYQYESAWGDIAFMLGYYPNHPRALQLWSELCLRWNSPKCQVSNPFPDAIARNPWAPATYVVYGIHLAHAGDLNQAIAMYKKALELDPYSVNAHYNLGLAYIDAKQYDLANDHANKAYALGSPFPGLRDKLKRAGKWQPIDDPLASLKQPPAPPAAPAPSKADARAPTKPGTAASESAPSSPQPATSKSEPAAPSQSTASQ